MSNKYGDKYRVHNLVKFDYSQIGEYIDEYHTDRPLRNDELVDLLNEQEERIQELEKENERLKEKEEYCDNICKSFGDYYGMNIENAEWFGFNGDVE